MISNDLIEVNTIVVMAFKGKIRDTLKINKNIETFKPKKLLDKSKQNLRFANELIDNLT